MKALIYSVAMEAEYAKTVVSNMQIGAKQLLPQTKKALAIWWNKKKTKTQVANSCLLMKLGKTRIRLANRNCINKKGWLGTQIRSTVVKRTINYPVVIDLIDISIDEQHRFEHETVRHMLNSMRSSGRRIIYAPKQQDRHIRFVYHQEWKWKQDQVRDRQRKGTGTNIAINSQPVDSTFKAVAGPSMIQPISQTPVKIGSSKGPVKK
jgi:hypothetical protein